MTITINDFSVSFILLEDVLILSPHAEWERFFLMVNHLRMR